MIYTLIISLLIEKPFYLMSPKIFSFQIVSEFIDIFVKFYNFMSRGWGFKPCPGGMVMDEIDTCITIQKSAAGTSMIMTLLPETWKYSMQNRTY